MIYLVLKAKAVYEFESAGDGELSIVNNEIVTILRQVRAIQVYYTVDINYNVLDLSKWN